jgi:hypothetical protein
LWERRNESRVLVGKHERKTHVGDLSINGRIVLKDRRM